MFGELDSRLGRFVSHDSDGAFDRIDEFVESGNRWHSKAIASDFDNYVDGNIDLLFEYTSEGRDCVAQVWGYSVQRPLHVANTPLHLNVPAEVGEIWNLRPQQVEGYASIVSYWGQPSMFVGNVDLINDCQHAVPSFFVVGQQAHDRLEEPVANSVGQPILYGFLKPVAGLRERELHRSTFLRACREWQHNLSIGEVEGGTKVVRGVSDDDGCAIYSGVVFFGEGGALAGIQISFDEISEGACFIEKCVKLCDAFRCPINF